MGAPYFNRFFVPVGLALLFLMAVAPALPWRKSTIEVMRGRLAVPAALGVLVVVACVLAGVHGVEPLLAFGLGAFAAASAGRALVLSVRGARRAARAAGAVAGPGRPGRVAGLRGAGQRGHGGPHRRGGCGRRAGRGHLLLSAGHSAPGPRARPAPSPATPSSSSGTRVVHAPSHVVDEASCGWTAGPSSPRPSASSAAGHARPWARRPSTPAGRDDLYLTIAAIPDKGGRHVEPSAWSSSPWSCGSGSVPGSSASARSCRPSRGAGAVPPIRCRPRWSKATPPAPSIADRLGRGIRRRGRPVTVAGRRSPVRPPARGRGRTAMTADGGRDPPAPAAPSRPALQPPRPGTPPGGWASRPGGRRRSDRRTRHPAPGRRWPRSRARCVGSHGPARSAGLTVDGQRTPCPRPPARLRGGQLLRQLVRAVPAGGSRAGGVRSSSTSSPVTPSGQRGVRRHPFAPPARTRRRSGPRGRRWPTRRGTWPSASGSGRPPSTFLIAPDGRVVAYIVAPVTAADLDQLIARAKARGGEEPSALPPVDLLGVILVVALLVGSGRPLLVAAAPTPSGPPPSSR